MKVSVEIPDTDLRDICRFTGEPKKSRAVLKLLTEALMLSRRRQQSEKFISGEWGAELDTYEAGQ